MPRKPRFYLIGIPQHVIQRGKNRKRSIIKLLENHIFKEEIVFFSKNGNVAQINLG